MEVLSNEEVRSRQGKLGLKYTNSQIHNYKNTNSQTYKYMITNTQIQVEVEVLSNEKVAGGN